MYDLNFASARVAREAADAWTAKTRDQVKAAGIDWCTRQSEELLEAGVPTLHFYTMGKANPTAEIARRVFGTVAI